MKFSQNEWARAGKLLWHESPLMTIAVILLTVFSGLAPAGVILFTERTITAVAGSLDSGELQSTAITSASLLIAITMAAFTLNIIDSYVQSLLQVKLSNKINLDIVRKATSLELQHFESSTTYDSLQRATSEAGSRPYQLFVDALRVLSGLTSLFSVSALLFAWNPWIAILLIVSCLPAFAAEIFYGRVTWKLEHDRAAKRRWASYLQFLTTNDRNVKEVKSFGLGRLLIQRVADIQRGFYDVDKSVEGRQAKVTALAGLLNVAVSGVAIIIAVRSALEIGNVGQLAGTIAAVTAVQSGASGVFVGLGQLFEHKLFLGELFSFLDTPHDVIKSGTRSIPRELKSGITFENVSFTYPGTDKAVLSNISFTAAPGEVIAFVGRNGAGKSTISKLINRLYDPTSGRIMLDGHPLAEYDISQLRSTVGVAFQDFVQYESSVQENVTYGAVNYLDDRVVSAVALNRAGADFVDELPSGLETRLGRWFEDSHQLSGGQWQRVAIARALAGDSQIILLDEPTAAVDSETEALLFRRLREVTQGAICFLISHRFSTVRAADKILVLENGNVVEMGDHRTLMNNGGHYASMFAIQAEGYQDVETNTRK